MSCPEPTALQVYLDGTASPAEAHAIRDHLQDCADCRSIVLALTGAGDATRDATSATATGADAETRDEAPGQLVGRYVILNRLGAGGMGVVYAAYDPELDRKVALKLIRRAARGPDGARDLQDRLVREAQAMARIAHPNVTAVHDVGRHGDQVYVAMELVNGETLAEWLATASRARAEIVDVFSRAGEGLRAAHAAGLVHRDFKPNNVMIDRDGRVRVMDFGLARPTGIREPAAPSSSPSRLDVSLTASGVLLGTPAYMAPEQLVGDPADARSDQFSFCVALYEALCNTRPFTGDDTHQLRAAIMKHELQRPKRNVPPWLLHIVDRGLAAIPDERWPSMAALLEALGRDPARLRRRWITAAGIVVAIATVVTTQRLLERHETQLCAGSERKLANVWDAARKEELRRVFDKSGVAYAATSFASVAALLDRYAGGWLNARAETCRATRVRGEQSEELMDLRMTCLDDRLGQLSATTDLLAHADAATVEKALRVVDALPPLDSCNDAKALRERVPPPRDAKQRAQLDALRARLNRTSVLFNAGKLEPALRDSEPLVRDATAANYAPLMAQARYRHGQILEGLRRFPEAEKILVAALIDAEHGHDDEQAGLVLNDLAYVFGGHEAKEDEGLLMLDLARAKFERTGLTDRDEFRLWFTRTTLANTFGHIDIALPAAEKALALARKVDPDGELLLRALENVGRSWGRKGQPAKAFEFYRETLTRSEKLLGAEHPFNFQMLITMATSLSLQDRYAESLVLFDRALALAKKISIDDNTLALTISNRGNILSTLHRYDEALAEQERALAMIEKLHDDDYLAGVLFNFGATQLKAGHSAAAVPLLERSLKIFDARHVRPLEAADTRFTLAQSLYEVGERARARTLATTARADLADRQKRLGGSFAPQIRDIDDWLAKHR